MTEPLTIAGRYQIQEFLGSGAYAIVYRAEDLVLRRVVSLKVLKPFWGTEPEVFERFVREARAAANLMHPQIAWVYDIGQDDDKHYLAQRYVPGIPLDKVIAQQGALPWSKAISILEQVGSALDFAHARGIVHRDIKPQNIILGEVEGAVLTDFGLTRALGDASRITQAGTIVGTPQYIAPEVWEGQPAGPASDQYALACIFFEVLTGNMMYEGPIIEAILMNGGSHIGQAIGPLTAGLPAQAFKVLRKALARRPEERFTSLANLVAALNEAVGEEDGVDQSDPALQRARDRLPDVFKEIAGEPGQIVDVEPTKPDEAHEQDGAGVDQTAQTGPLQEKDGWQAATGWQQGLRQVYQRLNNFSGEQAAAGYSLIPLDEDNALPVPGLEGSLLVDRDTVVLGRSASCDIVIHDADVSRQHAIIMVVAGRYILKDLRSTNGTYINGRRVITEAQLQDKDVIVLGKAVQLAFLVGQS